MPQKTEKQGLKETVVYHVHSSITHKSWKMEATQVSIMNG